MKEPIHLASLRPIADRKLVLDRRDSQRANHHSGEGIGKLALKHGTFTGEHPVVVGELTEEKWRKEIGEFYLRDALEIPLREFKVLGQDTEVEMFVSQNGADLANHLFHPNVG